MPEKNSADDSASGPPAGASSAVAPSPSRPGATVTCTQSPAPEPGASGTNATGWEGHGGKAPPFWTDLRKEGMAGPPYRLPAPCQPQAISYDPADEENSALHARMLTDAGTMPKRGDSLTIRAVAWCCAPWGRVARAGGWREIHACVALLADDGRLYRLLGWDAVSDFARLVLSTDRAAVADGLTVTVRTGESPAGDHWWWILGRPDDDRP